MNANRLRLIKCDDGLAVAFRRFLEPVVLQDEQVILKRTGAPYTMGSGILKYRQGILIAEVQEMEQPAAKRRRVCSMVAGLQNSEQNCFCNAVVQAIRFSDSQETLQMLPVLDDSVKDIAESFICYELQKVSRYRL